MNFMSATLIQRIAVFLALNALAIAQPGFHITASQKAFWSFQPLRKPELPKETVWARTPIDRFIFAKIEQAGLQPAAPADKRTLIRRATFDLIGLPPTPQDVDAFLADSS